MKPIKNRKRGSLAGWVSALLVISALLSGCATFNVNTFVDTSIPQQNKLPLRLAIDSDFINKGLNYTYRHEVGRDYSGSSPLGAAGTVHTYQVYYQTRTSTDRSDDAKYIINKSLGGMLPPNNSANGTLTIAMTRYQKGKNCAACMLFGVTVVPFLVGFPARGHFAEIDLVATITDKNGLLLKQYKRTGTHTSWDAIWGYDGIRGIERGACAGAVADAVSLIVEDLNKDFATISNKLSAL